jgi:hypothetical protein
VENSEHCRERGRGVDQAQRMDLLAAALARLCRTAPDLGQHVYVPGKYAQSSKPRLFAKHAFDKRGRFGSQSATQSLPLLQGHICS